MMINKNFVFNLTVINKALTKLFKISKLSDFNKNIKVILSPMTQIIREFKINNHVEKFASEFSKSVEELIDNNNLLIMNELFIVKVKNRSQEVKNKKKVMTRAEKAKTKFIKRNLFDFEHVKINLCYDDRDDRDDRDDFNDRDKQNNKKFKKFLIQISRRS